MKATLISALLVACGCGGNYSNQDLEYLNAVPNRDDLSSKLPSTGTSTSSLESGAVGQSSAALVVGDPSPMYAVTKGATVFFNASLDSLLSLIETLVALPPSARHPSSRVWGPIPDKHPGFSVEFVVDRDPNAPTHFDYRIELRSSAAGSSWFPVVYGSFDASSGIRKGSGTVTLDPNSARANGLPVDPSLNDLGQLVATYVTNREPIAVNMHLVGVPNGSYASLDYSYRQFADGQGQMGFSDAVAQGWTGEVQSRWLGTGDGRSDIAVLMGSFVVGNQVDCWDSKFLTTYETKSWDGTNLGSATACPNVQPFAP